MVKSSKIRMDQNGRILRRRNRNIQNGKRMKAKDLQINHNMQVQVYMRVNIMSSIMFTDIFCHARFSVY